MSPPVLWMHGKFSPLFPPWLPPPSADLQITFVLGFTGPSLEEHITLAASLLNVKCRAAIWPAELPQRLASWPLSRTHSMIWLLNRTRSHWFKMSFEPQQDQFWSNWRKQPASIKIYKLCNTFPSLSFSIQSVPVLLLVSALNPLPPFDNNSSTGPIFQFCNF